MEELRILMNETASQLLEYHIAMEMKGVGRSMGPQLMAEIGDVFRFTHKGAITVFAGVDPGVNDQDYMFKTACTQRNVDHLRFGKHYYK